MGSWCCASESVVRRERVKANSAPDEAGMNLKLNNATCLMAKKRVANANMLNIATLRSLWLDEDVLEPRSVCVRPLPKRLYLWQHMCETKLFSEVLNYLSEEKIRRFVCL